ncbi:MAG: SusC/RagA family TonB-linked outer membrane protein, partial [Tannerella sp.]|nr:SusC/RagA family TonB-linked outer membrane protein [Tannerella sp.]
MAKVIHFFQSRKCRRFFYSVFFAVTASLAVSAQQSVTKLEGIVVDALTGETVIGANVAVKDEKTGTVTSVEGTFSVPVNSFPVSLLISYIGYRTEEITVYESPKQQLTVKLSEDLNVLNEIVVVGYGTQRRRELTGSVASLSKTALEQTAVSIEGLLGGTISGVHVIQSSGQPGEGSAVRIRGGNSVYASNEPLYVIDGFIFFSEQNATKAGIGGIDGSLNPLASINPADIESIEVLKDVSAKAIYGSRGANGVILVTTKKGKRNGNTIQYQYTAGTAVTAKKLDILNATRWARVQKDYFYNKGNFTDEQIPTLGNGTDWQNAVLQTGTTQKHDISISGGDDKTRYLISGNYTGQKGIILNSGFERYSGRVNIDRELFKNLTAGITLTADQSKQDALTTFSGVNYNDSPFSHGIANSLTLALYMPPVVPVYNADGSYNYTNPFEYGYLSYYGKAANPVSDLNNSVGHTTGSTLLGNFYAKYDIIDGLTAKINAGANVNYITQKYFAPPYTALGINQDIRGMAAIGNRRTLVSQTEYLLTYRKQLNDAHYFDVLAGYTDQKTETNFVVAKANNIEKIDNLAAGKELPPISRDQFGKLQSLLGRINYTLYGRYNLTATYRADKSSRFAKGYEWGYFPSVGLSWNAIDEAFLESAKEILPTLKLRATYGIAGNQEIGFDEYEAYFNVGRYNGEAAVIQENLGNDKLKWETTAEYNIGLDAGLWDEKVTFTADAYFKETRDLLLKVPPPLGSATSAFQTVNLGNVTNKGVEFAVNVNLLKRKQFTWSVAANIARNINTLTSIGEEYSELTQGSDQEMLLRVGESVGSFYGFLFDGVVQS